jgi:hypothetical protein
MKKTLAANPRDISAYAGAPSLLAESNAIDSFFYLKGFRMQNQPVDRLNHGHHGIAAAIYVGALIVGAAMILSAELLKPARYEFHSDGTHSTYEIFDRDTGRATTAEFNSKHPISTLND